MVYGSWLWHLYMFCVTSSTDTDLTSRTDIYLLMSHCSTRDINSILVTRHHRTSFWFERTRHSSVVYTIGDSTQYFDSSQDPCLRHFLLRSVPSPVWTSDDSSKYVNLVSCVPHFIVLYENSFIRPHTNISRNIGLDSL